MIGKGVTRYEAVYRGKRRPSGGEAEEDMYEIVEHSRYGSTTVGKVFTRALALRFVNTLNFDLFHSASLARNLERNKLPPVLPHNLRTAKGRNGDWTRD